MKLRSCVLLALLFCGCATAAAPPAGPATPSELDRIASEVVVRRTEYGVPHILAENLRAAAFALAYVQLEDHGARVIEGMNAARGRAALVDGLRRADADAAARLRLARARASFDSLHADTRAVYEGFAAGMNHWIRLHADSLPAWIRPDYSAHDVLARDVTWPSDGAMERFRELVLSRPARAAPGAAGSDIERRFSLVDSAANVGSNAWALAPSRTTSGHAILLRNPHLSWNAGYYEAHVRVPGVLDFYGDFRIGGPFTVIGGFNPDLGFSTTNNAARSHEFYVLEADRDRPGHYLLDGRSLPVERELVTVEFVDSAGRHGRHSREFLSTPLGPVAHSDDRNVYVLRSAAMGDFRAGEQWLAMMRARSLEQWKDAMRMGARTTSNFTYADRAGNILYVWMSGAPVLPHEPGGDTVAIRASRTSDTWQVRMPFDSLPQLLNPPGGYVHNENDSPHFANLNAIITRSYSFPVEEPSLRLRSQHALELLHNDRRFTLEDVIAAKHSMRMLLADRVKSDLIAAVRATDTSADVAAALALLEQWDNTAAADSRGGVLFETWWNRYRQLMRGRDLHAVEWNIRQPMSTPQGLADHALAAEAFHWAVPETARRFGSWDVAWGTVHRVRRGSVDAPVGGCGGALGCFRVLNFTAAPDGRRIVDGGDGWVLAVEFGDEPRAYSVLAYGQSPDPESPWHDDQAALFAAGRMKRVSWTEAEIRRATVLSYRPGEELRAGMSAARSR